MREQDKTRAILDAIKDLHTNETFERALGRIVRNRRMSYEDYMDIIAEIRELANKKKIDLVEAARRIVKD
ncbi:MAG: hypothetical protein E3J35_04805 [Methanomassiliicoccales archaeon]|nr:MAG: hypothetical protein E3J35_04805 [Methanomassiliicoccales archaeon]